MVGCRHRRSVYQGVRMRRRRGAPAGRISASTAPAASRYLDRGGDAQFTWTHVVRLVDENQFDRCRADGKAERPQVSKLVNVNKTIIQFHILILNKCGKYRRVRIADMASSQLSAPTARPTVQITTTITHGVIAKSGRLMSATRPALPIPTQSSLRRSNWSARQGSCPANVRVRLSGRAVADGVTPSL